MTANAFLWILSVCHSFIFSPSYLLVMKLCVRDIGCVEHLIHFISFQFHSFIHGLAIFFLSKNFIMFHEINTTSGEWWEDEFTQKQTNTHARTLTLAENHFSEAKELVLCHAQMHYVMRIIMKVEPFLSFFLSECVRACVRVCLRVLNIYDDDQLYQNVGKSIIKIDGSKNNGAIHENEKEKTPTTQNEQMNWYWRQRLNERKKENIEQLYEMKLPVGRCWFEKHVGLFSLN